MLREMARKPTILCIDDMEMNLQIRVLMLQQFGCETLSAFNGTDGLRIAASEVIYLVLIAYHLASQAESGGKYRGHRGGI